MEDIQYHIQQSKWIIHRYYGGSVSNSWKRESINKKGFKKNCFKALLSSLLKIDKFCIIRWRNEDVLIRKNSNRSESVKKNTKSLEKIYGIFGKKYK